MVLDFYISKGADFIFHVVLAVKSLLKRNLVPNDQNNPLVIKLSFETQRH